MGMENKIVYTPPQRSEGSKKRQKKMISCDFTYMVIVLLILLVVAAGLPMYTLCVAGNRDDELPGNMYNELIK